MVQFGKTFCECGLALKKAGFMLRGEGGGGGIQSSGGQTVVGDTGGQKSKTEVMFTLDGAALAGDLQFASLCNVSSAFGNQFAKFPVFHQQPQSLQLLEK